MKPDDLIKRAEALIAKGQQLLGTRQSYRNVGGEFVDRRLFADFRTASLGFLSRVYGEESPHYREFDAKALSADAYDVDRGIGIRSAAKDELAGGWLATTKGLLSAEVFSDFLEMAEHLLSEGYKDPAAVLIGSVLEEHLRQLSGVHRLDTHFEKDGKQVPKKADLINAQLAKAGAYSKLDQKNVTALLGLRNQAAHGQYGEYAEKQVDLMYQSVLDFMLRNPAQ